MLTKVERSSSLPGPKMISVPAQRDGGTKIPANFIVQTTWETFEFCPGNS